jgi:hypothetical protein
VRSNFGAIEARRPLTALLEGRLCQRAFTAPDLNSRPVSTMNWC